MPDLAQAEVNHRRIDEKCRRVCGFRLQDDPLAALDGWIAKQKEPDLTRPEAIRRLVELGLKAKGK